MVPMLVATVMRMPSSTVLPNAPTITPLVTVLVVIPSAMILPGTGVSDMLPAAGPGCKMMLLSPVIIDNRVPVGDSTLRTAVPLTVPVSVLVTTPETVVPLPVIAPSVDTTLTVVPSGTRLPLASLTVTVRSAESVLFAIMVVFDAAMLACAGGPGLKTTVKLPVTLERVVPLGDWTPSTPVPLTVLVSVRVTTPLIVVPVPVTVPIVVVTVTVVPSATRLLFASNTVTVNILLSKPSATSVVFDADITALAGTPGSNVILVFPVTVASVVPDGDSTPRTEVPVINPLK